MNNQISRLMFEEEENLRSGRILSESHVLDQILTDESGQQQANFRRQSNFRDLWLHLQISLIGSFHNQKSREGQDHCHQKGSRSRFQAFPQFFPKSSCHFLYQRALIVRFHKRLIEIGNKPFISSWALLNRLLDYKIVTDFEWHNCYMQMKLQLLKP